MSESLCPKCKGARLKPQSLAVKIVGKSIAEVTKMSITDAINYLSTLNLKDREKFIASRILKELNQRLRFLNDVGLGYLTLDRRMSSLSGGEKEIPCPLGSWKDPPSKTMALAAAAKPRVIMA